MVVGRVYSLGFGGSLRGRSSPRAVPSLRGEGKTVVISNILLGKASPSPSSMTRAMPESTTAGLGRAQPTALHNNELGAYK